MSAINALVIFDGRPDGLVSRMARKVVEGARGAGADAIALTADQVKPDDLLKADVIIIGSPSHFAGPSAKVKNFMDSTWPLRGQLAGKVGAVFAASRHLAGGQEFTMFAGIAFFLTHGMIIEGNDQGDALGAILVAPEGETDEAMSDDPEECRRLGEKTVRLAAKLK